MYIKYFFKSRFICIWKRKKWRVDFNKHTPQIPFFVVALRKLWKRKRDENSFYPHHFFFGLTTIRVTKQMLYDGQHLTLTRNNHFNLRNWFFRYFWKASGARCGFLFVFLFWGLFMRVRTTTKSENLCLKLAKELFNLIGAHVCKFIYILRCVTCRAAPSKDTTLFVDRTHTVIYILDIY